MIQHTLEYRGAYETFRNTLLPKQLSAGHQVFEEFDTDFELALRAAFEKGWEQAQKEQIEWKAYQYDSIIQKLEVKIDSKLSFWRRIFKSH